MIIPFPQIEPRAPSVMHTVSGGLRDDLSTLEEVLSDFDSVDAFSQWPGLPGVARELLPHLTEVAEAAFEILSTVRPFVAVHGLGLAERPVDTRRAVLAAFAAIVGLPTETDRVHHKVLWDVTARAVNYKPTVTQHSGRAGFHTDSSYFPEPERFALLHVDRPAADGGVTSLINGNHLLYQLGLMPGGAECEAYLRQHKVPFRVPAAFTKNASDDDVEINENYVLAPHRLRYRRDSIDEAWKLAAPSAEEREMIERFEAAIDLAPKTSIWLPQDTLLLLDNWRCLHDRSAFRDKTRFLCRIRMTNED